MGRRGSVITLRMHVLSRHLELSSEQLPHGAHHSLESADIRVRLRPRALLAEVPEELRRMRLHIAASPCPGGPALRERDFIADVGALPRPLLELLAIEDILLVAGAEEEPQRRARASCERR